MQVFREIKDAFDPSNILNPGKVIGDDPHLLARDLKQFPIPAAALLAEAGSGSGHGHLGGLTAKSAGWRWTGGGNGPVAFGTFGQRRAAGTRRPGNLARAPLERARGAG